MGEVRREKQASTQRRGTKGVSGAALVALPALTVLAAAGAVAQTVLPPIVVTTPTPTASSGKSSGTAAKSNAPARKRPTQPSPPTQAAQQAPAQPPPTAADDAPAPGVLIIPDKAFASVAIVPQREIMAHTGSNLADTLQYMPGISASNFAAGASRPVIRGLDNNRVRIQENGIGSHDVSALSEDHAVPIDPNAADRIEVVRGPATLRYGSQAIGGVVDATNGRIPEAIPRNGVSGEIRGGLSSVDNGRESAFKVTAGAGNFVAHADGFDRNAQDYDTPHGRQLNSFSQASGQALGGSFVGSDGFMGLSFSRYSSLYGIPGGESAENRTRIDMEQVKLQSRGEWRPKQYGIETVRYWLGYSNYGHNEISFNDVEGHDEIGSRFTNREMEGRVEIQHVPVGTMIGELRGSVGVQWGRRALQGQSFEGDSLLDLARTRTAAAFLFEELQLTQKLRVQGAVRYEHNNVTGDGLDVTDPLAAVTVNGDRTFKPVSLSSGVLYDLPAGLVLRGTAQLTERAPDAAELYSKGMHEATGTFEIGSPFLTTERARTFEVGLRRAKGDFRFDASLYHTRFDGFIFKRLTGTTCGERYVDCQSAGGAGGDLKELQFDQRDATFYGAELIGQLDVGRLGRGVFGVEAQYDFVRATFEGGENVPRIPPHRVGGGVYWRDANWLAKVNLLHAFRQNEIAPEETPTSGYTLLNAELSYTTRLPRNGLGPEMTIGLRGDNLLNDDVRNSVSFKKDEVLLPGANVKLFGSIKLN